MPESGVIGIRDAYLDPGFWVARMTHPDGLLMDRAAITAQNARLQQLDPSMHDLRAIPATLDRATVRGWIEDLSERPTSERFDVDGADLPVGPMLRIISVAVAEMGEDHATLRCRRVAEAGDHACLAAAAREADDLKVAPIVEERKKVCSCRCRTRLRDG